MDMIVTTEKDAVRLEKPGGNPEVPIYFLRIEVGNLPGPGRHGNVV